MQGMTKATMIAVLAGVAVSVASAAGTVPGTTRAPEGTRVPDAMVQAWDELPNTERRAMCALYAVAPAAARAGWAGNDDALEALLSDAC